NTALARASQRCRIPNTIEEVGPEGDAVRARIGREAYDINVGQFCCGGLYFGYFYPDSPIIAYDSETAPTYSIDQFSQSTVPGCRTPHLWLRDGRSLYDVLGSDFTLLRFDPRVEIGGFVGAAAHRGVPMAVVDVDAAEAAALYPCKLLLSRPDQHVAWRGDSPPADPIALIDRVRGASTGGVASRYASIIGGTMRAKTLAAAECEVERPYLRVALLCGVVLFLEGYDIAAVGYAIPSLVDAWRVDPSAFTEALVAGN